MMYKINAPKKLKEQKNGSQRLQALTINYKFSKMQFILIY